MCLLSKRHCVYLWANGTTVSNNIFQLTPEAERKVVQSRELLDTIVKENKGCNINKVKPLKHDPAAAPPVFIIYYLFLTLTLTLSSCLRNYNGLWKICPDGHSCEQAEVRTLCSWDQWDVSHLLACPSHAVLSFPRELQENLVRSHSAGRNLVGDETFHNLLVACDKSSTVGEAQHVLFCRCGEPAEPRKDPHAARTEDQCPGQRAQRNFSGNPARHDPGLQW